VHPVERRNARRIQLIKDADDKRSKIKQEALDKLNTTTRAKGAVKKTVAKKKQRSGSRSKGVSK